jgi:hypothetical protein
MSSGLSKSGRIKRPPNSFFVYVSKLREQHDADSSGPVYQRDFNKEAGLRWRALPAVEKEYYKNLSNIAKVEHSIEHPDYKYEIGKKPRANARKARRKPRPQHLVPESFQPELPSTSNEAPNGSSANERDTTAEMDLDTQGIREETQAPQKIADIQSVLDALQDIGHETLSPGQLPLCQPHTAPDAGDCAEFLVGFFRHLVFFSCFCLFFLFANEQVCRIRISPRYAPSTPISLPSTQARMQWALEVLFQINLKHPLLMLSTA